MNKMENSLARRAEKQRRWHKWPTLGMKRGPTPDLPELEK